MLKNPMQASSGSPWPNAPRSFLSPNNSTLSFAQEFSMLCLARCSGAQPNSPVPPPQPKPLFTKTPPPSGFFTGGPKAGIPGAQSKGRFFHFHMLQSFDVSHVLLCSFVQWILVFGAPFYQRGSGRTTTDIFFFLWSIYSCCSVCETPTLFDSATFGQAKLVQARQSNRRPMLRGCSSLTASSLDFLFKDSSFPVIVDISMIRIHQRKWPRRLLAKYPGFVGETGGWHEWGGPFLCVLARFWSGNA